MNDILPKFISYFNQFKKQNYKINEKEKEKTFENGIITHVHSSVIIDNEIEKHRFSISRIEKFTILLFLHYLIFITNIITNKYF
jgi:hypothetical protein